MLEIQGWRRGNGIEEDGQLTDGDFSASLSPWVIYSNNGMEKKTNSLILI